MGTKDTVRTLPLNELGHSDGTERQEVENRADGLGLYRASDT